MSADFLIAIGILIGWCACRFYDAIRNRIEEYDWRNYIIEKTKKHG